LTRAECYRELGLSPDASADEIRQAYRRRAHELHPDRNPEDPRAEEKFKKLSEAYQILTQTEPPTETAPGFFAYLVMLVGDLVKKLKERPRRGEDLSYHLRINREDLSRGGKFLLDLPDKKLEVRVPPNTDDGARIRIAGEGEPGQYGGPPGDLIVFVTTNRE
jgi:DnaJ-class molecular chaperone